MAVASRPALRAAAVLTLALCTSTGCKGEDAAPGPAFPVDGRYASGDEDAPLPPGASEVSPEDFSAQLADGGLILTGPEADREVEAREAKQDSEDLQLVQEFERLHPNAPKLLPQLQPVTDGSVRPQGDGTLQVDVVLAGSASKASFLTMGERFRLRAVARSLREFPTRENQLATYERFYTELPEVSRTRLQLPPLDAVKDLSAAELLALNDTIAGQWRDILGAVVKPAPVLPPSCDGDEGVGTAGDRFGNRASCGYSDRGLMKNLTFPGKEHVSCVKDQAARGTCPAFSTVSTMEWSVHRRLGRRVNLSEQALYARMKLTWGGGQTYGDGYWPNLGFNQSFAEGYLVPFENQWDYNPSMSRRGVMDAGADGITGSADDVLVGYRNSCTDYPATCSDSTHQTQTVCTRVAGRGTFCGYAFPDVNPGLQGFRVSTGTVNYWDPANRELSTAKMMLAVGLFGSPVVWGFDVQTSAWGADADGFVRFLSATETARIGGHAVHTVGLVMNSELAQVLPNAPPGSGGGYFIVKNSWSNCWGDGGFAYIPFDSVKAYTLEMVSAPSVR